MSEKLHRFGGDLDMGNPRIGGAAPGKVPTTARLGGRPQVVFRVESAEAARELASAFGPRDPNGVAAGADAAVDRAASSSGSALPTTVRRQFESSLGADLSSVRVHTGSDSETAARAVGAKAYTVGNDIHFGAGQYAPSDPFGVHLLAHEVAHTQQQAGAAPTRQHKLEVSTPGDAFEVEADRAADAMVAGARASITGGGSGLGRKVMRDASDEYKDVSGSGEDAAQNKAYDLEASRGKPGDTTTYLGASNVEDRSQAIQQINAIAPYTPVVAMSGKTDRVAQNDAAVAALRDYVRASADQNFAQSLFEPEFERVKIGFSRLESMFATHFAKSGTTPSASGTGVDLANQAATAGTSKTADQASDLKRSLQGQAASNDVVTNNQMQTLKADIQSLQRQLGGYGGALGATSDGVINANKALKNALNVQAGPQPTLAETDDEKAARIASEGVKNDLASAVQTVGAVGSLAKTVAGAVPGGEEATKVVETAKESFETGMKFGNAAARNPGDPVPKVDLTEEVVKYFGDFDAKMAAADGKLASIHAGNAATWARNAVADVKAKGGALKSAWSAHQHNMEAFDKLQATLRAQTDKLAKMMPKPAPGQPDLGVALSLQNESTAFAAQCDGALAVGKRERDEAHAAKDAKKAAANGSDYAIPDPSKYFGAMVQEQVGLTYWECRRIPGVDEGYEAYQWGERKVSFTKTPQNQSNTQESLDGRMDHAISEIGTMKTKATEFAARMAELTGIGSGRY